MKHIDEKLQYLKYFENLQQNIHRFEAMSLLRIQENGKAFCYLKDKEESFEIGCSRRLDVRNMQSDFTSI